MGPDEPGAILMLVDESRKFIGQNTHDYFVIQKRASGGTAQDIANFFANDPRMASSHYVVGQDGTIVQVVLEKNGAAANCCLETGHASFLPLGVNLNVKSVSIEHCDSSTSNDTPLTTAQKTASFRLVQHICERHNIPKRRATNDGKGGIIGHNDIAPLSRARCPNVYPWDELFTYLANGGQDVSTTIDLNTPHMSDYFPLLNGNQSQRKNGSNGKTIILHGDMLKYYQTNGCVPYCGFSSAGLPLSNELKIEQFGPEFAKLAGSGIVVVFFERAVWVYDKDHIIDHPLDAGTVYPLHLYSKPGQDPLVGQLLKQIADLQAQIVQLQTQPPPMSNPDPIAAIHAVQAAVAPFK